MKIFLKYGIVWKVKKLDNLNTYIKGVKMIDFTNCIEKLNNYKGSEKKKTLVYENKKYLWNFQTL